MDIVFDEEKFRKNWIIKVKKNLKIAKKKNDLFAIGELEKELIKYNS